MTRAMVLALLAAAGCGGTSADMADDASAGSGDGAGSQMATPPAPPHDLHTVPGAYQDQCILAWTPPPQAVDGYDIQCDAPGWSFADDDTHGGVAPRGAMVVLAFYHPYFSELSQIPVQIRSRNHGAVSAYAPPVTCTLPVVMPQDVEATLEPDDTALRWSSYSSVATAFEVERAPLDAAGAPGDWSVIATVPVATGFTQSLIDPAAPAAGSAYAYRVTALSAAGDRSAAATATSVPRGAALTTSTVTLPPAVVTVADRAGHYALLREPAGGLVVTWGDGAAWTSSPTITATPYAPYLRLDAAGLPHTVYGVAAAGGVAITHGWSDGVRWHEDTIATRAALSDLTFDLDATGAPVVMWTSSANPTYEVARKRAGSWAVQSLATLTRAMVADGYTLFRDASGMIHLILSTSEGMHHLQLEGDAWHDERAPGSPFAGPVVAVGRDPAHLAVCYNEDVSGAPSQPLCVRKTPDGWRPPERLPTLPSGAPGAGTGWIAMSDDGARLAVLFQNAGSQLLRSDAPGTWTELAFPRHGTGATEPAQLLAFDAAGKLSILVDPNAATDQTATTVAYQRWTEP